MNGFARFVLALALIGVFAVAAQAEEPPVPGPPDNAALQYWQGSASMSEATRKRLENFDTVALDGDALADMSDDNPSIAFIHAGAAMGKCDWGLDLRKGPELLMPHLNMMRVLGRLTLMRARYRFEQRRWHDGLADVLATCEMAKDAGDTPIMISLLVRYNIEQLSIDTLARHLDRMDPPALDELAKALEAVPAPDQFKRVFPAESKYFVDWVLDRLAKIEKESSGDAAKWSQGVLSLSSLPDVEQLRRDGVPSPAQLKEMINAIKKSLVEEERIADLSVAEQDAWLAELGKSLPSNVIFRNHAPTQTRIFLHRRRWQAHHAMLKAAVAVAREGEAVLQDKRYADPFGDAPFTYRKTDGGGFELQSKLVVDAKPVTLAIGAPKK